MKNLTLVLLVVASLILGAMAFASCDASDLPFIKCDHEFVEEVTKTATCTEEGAKKLTCSKCDEVVEEVIPALGHDFAAKFTTDVAATCAVEGSKSKHCSRCDAVTEVTVIAKADHTWAETYTVDAEKTCTVNGQKSKHCTECDAIDEESIITDFSSGHAWDLAFTIDTSKTCTTTGWESIHCQNCSETKEGRVIPASHNWDDDYTVDANFTCEKDGQKSIHCADCTEVKDVTVLKAHHVLGDDAQITKPASLFANGVRTGTCVNCTTVQNEAVTANIQIVDGSVGEAGYANAKIGTVEGGTEWVYKKSIAALDDDNNKYYPTATDADGKAVIMEMSILLNETMSYTKSKTYLVMRVQKGSTKTNLGNIDFIGDDYDDACGSWITSDTQTGYSGPTKVVNDVVKQAATRIENGWHRFGFKLRQVVIAKDAAGAEIALTAGQPTDSTKVIATLTYKWVFEYYIDGVLDRTGYYEGISAGNNKAGIWDAGNLLYTATISEDGKTIIYADATDSEVFLRFSMADAFKNGSTIKTAVADPYVTIGDDFVQKVTPATYNTNGGTAVKTLVYDGCDYSFPNIAFYTVDGADTTEFQFEKRGFKQTGVDNTGSPIWALEDNHTEHFSVTPNVIYKATPFSEGLETYTCDACGKTGVIEVLPKTDISNVNYAAYCKKDAGGPASVDNCVDLFKQGSAVISNNKDFMVEVSLLYNESMKDTEGDVSPNLRFKNASGQFLIFNTKTGNIAFKSSVIEEENVANGISTPSINLAYGWHRIGVQIRPYAKIVDNAIVYGCAFRLYVDGELMNDAGTWTEATAKFASTYKFFETSIVDNQIKYGADVRNDILWRYGDFRTKNNYGALIFDDVCLNSVERTVTDTGVYADMFKVNVTPLDSARAYAKGKKLVLDANGGSFSTQTFSGTYKAYDEVEEVNYTAAYDYVLTNTVWFQLPGAAQMPVPTPTNYGALFIGWEKVETEDTVTYVAQWTAIHEHAFIEDLAQHVDATCLAGKKVSYCSICGAEKVEVLPSVGVHNYVKNTQESYDPKCGVAGATIEYCSYCNDKKTTPITALTHNYLLNTTESYAPGCTTTGANISYCEHCTDKKTEVIPALGHDFEKHEKMTTVFHFTDWSESKTTGLSLNTGKDFKGTGGTATYINRKDTYLELKGRYSSNSTQATLTVLGSYDLSSMTAADNYVFTISLNGTLVNNVVGSMWVNLYDSTDKSYDLIEVERSTGNVLAWLADETFVLGNVADGWKDYTVALDVANGKVTYFVNGVEKKTANVTLPTTFTKMEIKRGTTAANAILEIDNLSFYAGTINHYALYDIFSSNNATNTTYTNVYEGIDIVEGEISCSRPGCGHKEAYPAQ